MKVWKLIKELQKFDPDAEVGTFADDKWDFTFTPIEETILVESVELHQDFRRRGKQVYSDWVILAAPNQEWRGIE